MFKKSFLPRRSGVHRIAAFALYRALLNQCRQVGIDDAVQISLQNVVRNRFQKHRNLTSRQLLLSAFVKGYEALDILDRAAAGEAADLQRVQAYLAAAPAAWKQPFQPKPQAARPYTKDQAWPDEPLPEPADTYQRPFLNIPGQRSVPRFRSTWGYSFLLFKNPQPLRLNQRITRWRKRHVSWNRMVKAMDDQRSTVALWESEWDRIVEKEWNGQIKDSGKDYTWTEDLETFGIEHVLALKKADAQRNFERGKQLLQIIEDEKLLASREEFQRRAASVEEAVAGLLESWEKAKTQGMSSLPEG